MRPGRVGLVSLHPLALELGAYDEYLQQQDSFGGGTLVAGLVTNHERSDGNRPAAEPLFASSAHQPAPYSPSSSAAAIC